MLRPRPPRPQNTANGSATTITQQVSPAELRLKKDFEEFKDGDVPNVKLTFTTPGDLRKFEAVYTIKDECLWKGGVYKFTVEFTPNYPMEAPKVHLETPIYHPNIDT